MQAAILNHKEDKDLMLINMGQFGGCISTDSVFALRSMRPLVNGNCVCVTLTALICVNDLCEDEGVINGSKILTYY
jgi:hypothetical protein